jgi:hypothetical protein
LREIRLALAALHEFPLASAQEGDRVHVVFLSNATEKHFMTLAEFDALLANVKAAMLPGQRAVFVHHAAGEPAFGLYELENASEPDKFVLRTLCRDEYIRDRKNGGEVYETWFERKLAREAEVQPCSTIPR